MDTKKNILNLKPLNFKDYESFDLDRLVVYTLSFLENRNIPLYFDYITVALFKLFPNLLSLKLVPFIPILFTHPAPDVQFPSNHT